MGGRRFNCACALSTQYTSPFPGCNHLQPLHALERGDGARACAVHMGGDVLGDQLALGFVRHLASAEALAGLADSHLAQLEASAAGALAVAPSQQHMGQLGASILDSLRQHPGQEPGVRVHQAGVLRQAGQDLHAALHVPPAFGHSRNRASPRGGSGPWSKHWGPK